MKNKQHQKESLSTERNNEERYVVIPKVYIYIYIYIRGLWFLQVNGGPNIAVLNTAQYQWYSFYI